MKKFLFLTIAVALILAACDHLTLPNLDLGGGDEDESVLNVVINLFQTDSSGLPAFPFIHSDSDHAFVRVVLETDDDWKVVEKKEVSLNGSGGSVTAGFNDLEPDFYQIWVTTYDVDDSVRSFGYAGVDIHSGGAVKTPLLAPGISSFNVEGTDGDGNSQDLAGVIEGPRITVTLPDQAFTVTGWTADCSRGADNDIVVHAGAFPSGGGWVDADGTSGLEMINDSSDISMYDQTAFSLAMGVTDEFFLQVAALNSETVRKRIGWTDYQVEFTYSGQTELEKIDTPIISPSTGDYTGSVEITITSEEEGTTIWYTDDGTNPGLLNRNEYTESLVYTSDVVIRAYASKDGMADSQVVSEYYNFNMVEVDSPIFEPGGGTFDPGQTVTMSCSTFGVEIRYTTDGTEPSRTSGTVYEESVPPDVDYNTTIKAMAWMEGMIDSGISQAEINIRSLPPETPLGLVSSETYNSPVNFVVTHESSGVEFFYEVQGDMIEGPSMTTGDVTLENPSEDTTANINVLLTAVETGRVESDPLVISSVNLTPDLPENVIVVDGSAGATGDGRTWQTAMNDLQEAIDYVDGEADFNDIWVRAGTYIPDSWPTGEQDGMPFAAHFTLRDNMIVQGGFAGFEYENDINRNPFENPSILSGDINGDDNVTGTGDTLQIQNNGDNLYNVLRITNPTPLQSSFIDGFIISGGNALGSSDLKMGGGIYVNDTGNTVDAGLVVSNCLITGNQSFQGGAGAALDGNAYVYFVDTIFQNNHATDSSAGNGGGVLVNAGNHGSHFMNCVFSSNRAGKSGGALYFSDDGTLENSTLLSNYADSDGGAVAADFAAGNTFTGRNLISWNNVTSGTDNFMYTGTGGTCMVEYSVIEEVPGCSEGDNRIWEIDSGVDPGLKSYSNMNGADDIWFTEDDGYLISNIASSAIDYSPDVDTLDWFDYDGDLNFLESHPTDILYRGRQNGTSPDCGAGEYY